MRNPPNVTTFTAHGASLIKADVLPCIDRQKVAHLDWHDDVSKLILDINDALAASADEKVRGVLIRRLRRALDGVPASAN